MSGPSSSRCLASGRIYAPDEATTGTGQPTDGSQDAQADLPSLERRSQNGAGVSNALVWVRYRAAALEGGSAARGGGCRRRNRVAAALLVRSGLEGHNSIVGTSRRRRLHVAMRTAGERISRGRRQRADRRRWSRMGASSTICASQGLPPCGRAGAFRAGVWRPGRTARRFSIWGQSATGSWRARHRNR